MTDAVAEEISWLTTMLLFALTLMFSLPAVSAIEAGGVEGEMASTLLAALMAVAAMQYGIHLLRHNPIVRQCVESFYKRVGWGESQG